jgi:hypothetical protein
MAFSSHKQDTVPQKLDTSHVQAPVSYVRGRYWESICYGLFFLVALFFLVYGVMSNWQDGSSAMSMVFVLLAMLVVWIAAGHAAQIERLIRAGYAIKLDPQGFHHFNMPSIPWSDLSTVTVEVFDNGNRTFTYLCLGTSGHTQMLIAGKLWWSNIVGQEIKLHDSARAILIPCEQLGEEPNRLAHRLNRMIREYQGRKS